MPRWPPPSGSQALRPRAPQDGPLARSQRVSSRRLREASGWAPRMRAGTETWEPDRRMTAAERFAQARPRLLRLAYSELGDVGEAEDVVQEAWLRLERADAEAIENLDGWLTTVVARLALDRLRSARARRETYVGPWLPEPLVSDDPADRVTLDESVSYALLTVLEQLSPAERTAFVLHDVFDVPFGDVAEVVGRTPEAVRQLASRARRHVTRERPRFAASRDEHDRAVRAFAQAVAEGSLEGLVAVLDPDVVWTSDGGGRASAARKPLRGGARVARAWAAFSRRATHEPIEIELNGRLGLVLPSSDGHRAALSFVVSDGRITRIDAVRNPEKLRRLWRERAAPLVADVRRSRVARAMVAYCRCATRRAWVVQMPPWRVTVSAMAMCPWPGCNRSVQPLEIRSFVGLSGGPIQRGICARGHRCYRRYTPAVHGPWNTDRRPPRRARRGVAASEGFRCGTSPRPPRAPRAR